MILKGRSRFPDRIMIQQSAMSVHSDYIGMDMAPGV